MGLWCEDVVLSRPKYLCIFTNYEKYTSNTKAQFELENLPDSLSTLNYHY